MNVGRLFRESERRQAAALITKATAPRPWAAMLVTWRALMGELCSFLPAPDADQGRRLVVLAERIVGAVPDGGREEPLLHLFVWRWMWSLPPCSEVRKAAFTLGAAALLVDRWREELARTQGRTAEHSTAILNQEIGQRAESLMRISAWHIDDARQETRAPGGEPTMPAHIRVYAHSQPIDPERGGVNFCGVMNDSDRRRVTLATLDDFVRHAGERKPLKPSDDALIALAPALIETLGASLPAGPWIVTSQDVWRFLSELLLEDEAFHCGTGGGSTAPTPPESAGPCEQRSVPSNAPQPSRHPRVVHMHHHPKPTEPRACQSDQAQQAAEPAAPPAPLLPALLAIHEAEKGEDALVALSAARQDRTVDAVAAEETFAKWLVAKARAAKTEETVTRIEGALRRASLGAKLNREIGETITKAKRALAGAPRE